MKKEALKPFTAEMKKVVCETIKDQFKQFTPTISALSASVSASVTASVSKENRDFKQEFVQEVQNEFKQELAGND